MKTPIIITAFGTTTKAVDTYDYMDAKIRERFPDHEIRWSYTSRMVRNLVKEKQKIELKSTKEVLTELQDNGYDQAVVQSLHVLCGAEFHRLINETKQCRIRTSIGLPLLSSPADYSALIAGIGNIFSTPDNDEAVVLVGHGTEHPVWSSYIALEYLLQKEYNSNIYVGVVEGGNSCDRIVQAVKGKGIKRVLLVPFMIVAGVHFKEDLIGDSEDSWKSRFEREGIEVLSIDKGLGYHPFIVDIFIDHIKQALDAITSHQRQLRGGFTTGTCAAAAAKAAVSQLVEGIVLREVMVALPDGERVTLPLEYVRGDRLSAEAAICKDAGDDPDITNGLTIIAGVSPIGGNDIVIAGGEGVGTVTKLGLSIEPGQPAINPAPQSMIRQAIREVTPQGVKVTISIPGGAAAAARTFNPRLGIVGGLSILGTSGRVRPFSCSAMRASLMCLLKVSAACGITAPVLVPGHIGERAANKLLQVSAGQVIEAGNEWGFILDAAAQMFTAILILGHPGKLAKLAMGQWDTHSTRSKSAVPFVADLAGRISGRKIQDVPTVEGIFQFLPAGRQKRLGDILADKVHKALTDRRGGKTQMAVMLVNMKGELLGSAGDVQKWM